MKTNRDIGLFLIRVGVGLVFLVHGINKFADIQGTLSFFSQIGLSPFWAYLVSVVEIVGGLSMLLGIAAGWAGIILAVDMIGATILVKASKGFLGGYEFDLLLFLASLAISLTGPGSYTLRGILKRPE